MINPFKTKKGLGRGLSSLIGDVDSKLIKNKILIKKKWRSLQTLLKSEELYNQL